jgi:PAS domain S-box-containing protein
MGVADWLLDPAGLTPHGFCLSWQPGLVVLHAVSDAVIGVSYFSIPIALASLTRQRRDLQYSWILYAFVGFIVACSTTHLFSILTLWVPAYGIEGLVKAVTAVLSLATATLLWPLVPRLVALPSPAELRRVNYALSNSVAELEQTAGQLRSSEARVQASNVELERRVAERTSELKALNEALTAALAERDVTQQALARSEAEFRASFEGSVVGKALMEPGSRRILRSNPVLAALLGYEPDELVGRTATEFTWPDDRDADDILYARLLSGEVTQQVQEKRYIRRDGSPFWVRVSATLAHAPMSEHPILTIVSIEDVDTRYMAQAGLEAAKRDLERVVEDRTRALEQRDLLLREVYHRVKNNLQIVDGLLVMRALRIEDPAARQSLLDLRSRVYALGLVHQQLMGSLDLKTFDIVPFLHELSTNLLDGGTDGSVSLSVDAYPLRVGLDFAVPFGLLVTELVTNSIKHAFPGGTGNIVVVLRPDENDQLLLVVRDDGVGIADARHGGHPKAGLGMDIVKSLVAQLGGTMIAYSEVGMITEIRTPMPVQQ